MTGKDMIKREQLFGLTYGLEIALTEQSVHPDRWAAVVDRTYDLLFSGSRLDDIEHEAMSNMLLLVGVMRSSKQGDGQHRGPPG